MRSVILLSKLLFIAIILSGCWGLRETERLLYVHGIGVDFVDGEYEVFLQLLFFTSVAKNDSPGAESGRVEVGSERGKTLEEALRKLHLSVDEEMVWGHLSFVVFSEEVLKNGWMNPVIDSIIRYVETRYRIWIYSTKEDLREVLMTAPVVNKSANLSRLGSPINTFKKESYVKPVDIRELFIALDEPNHEAVLPMVGITETWKSNVQTTKSIELIGAGIMTPNEFKGFITGTKLYGLGWVTKGAKQVQASFLVDKEDENSYASAIAYKIKPKITPVVMEDDEVKFDIHVSFTASANIIPRDMTTSFFKKRFEEAVKEQIMEAYLEGLKHDADIYRLSEQLYRKNNKVWKRLEKDGKIEIDENSIREIDVDIRRFLTGRKRLIESIK